MAVTGFIIIPADYFDHFSNDGGHQRIKRTRIRTIVYVDRNYGVFGVKKDIF